MCPKETAKRRFLARKAEGRENDDDARFDTRAERHERENPAIVEYYRKAGRLVEVDSSDGMMGEDGTYYRLVWSLVKGALSGNWS